jgi:broad specificity phosphatase PhoE
VLQADTDAGASDALPYSDESQATPIYQVKEATRLSQVAVSALGRGDDRGSGRKIFLSRQASARLGLPEMPDSEAPVDAIESWVRSHPHVSLENPQSGADIERSQDSASGGSQGLAYMLDQTFAIIRHADRLDHTPAWQDHPDKEKWPNDTPLTEDGHKHATEVGQILKDTGKPFQVIISSPYYRCAQTASRIAECLNIPVHFDLDLGEVFDGESMLGEVAGLEQHRPPKVLKALLRKRFPRVEYVCDEDGVLSIEGKLPRFPEPFAGARMRFAYKTQLLLQEAAAQLMDIVIVTHGDGLAAVVGMMRDMWAIRSVPYTAHAIASRKVKVMEKGTGVMLSGEEVYRNPEQWYSLSVSKGFVYKEASSERRKQQMKNEHTQDMKAMDKQAKYISNDYELQPHQHENMVDALKRLGASDKEMRHMMFKAKRSTTVGDLSKSNGSTRTRVYCSPSTLSTLSDLAREGSNFSVTNGQD